MGRKSIDVTTLHGFTIKELQGLASKVPSHYTRCMLQAVIMRSQGISTTDIMKTLGRSRPVVVAYIKEWNESPANIKDQRGNNVPSKMTNEMIEDIKELLINRSPKEYGYDHSKWTCELLSKYIADHYGAKFCHQWIAKILKSLNFSYKRGIYMPTKADPLLQEEFKKNVNFFGYF